MAEGRVRSFTDSYAGVRNPTSYRRTSVLDTLMPTPNGQSVRDLQHSLTGRRSEIGQSEGTAEQQVWLR